MVLHWWFEEAQRRHGVSLGAPNCYVLDVSRDEWRQAAENIAAGGGRLLSLWATRNSDDRTHTVRAALLADPGVLVLSLRLTASDAYYPGIEQQFPCASRMQRAVYDLSGLRTAAADTRPWLRHASWPSMFHPLSADPAPQSSDPSVDDYAFV